jgi:hypothetical protein
MLCWKKPASPGGEMAILTMLPNPATVNNHSFRKGVKVEGDYTDQPSRNMKDTINGLVQFEGMIHGR